ncbi:alpha/beta-hydrolase, partial [Aureobasidium melanogenum]
MSHPNTVFSNNIAKEQSTLIITQQIILPREPEPEPTSRIIFSKSRSFVGREDVLKSIEHSLHEFGVAALTGPGGIGKTEAAIEYCHRFHESHQDFWIFWVHAGSREEFKNDYRGIALTLKLIKSIAVSDEIVFRLLGDWFQDSENWLLVVDNADCYKDFYGSAPSKSSEPAFLAGYLPCFEPHRKRILFTSRDVDLGIKLSEGSLVIVDRLSDADSSNLFRKRIAASRSSQKSAGGEDRFLEQDVQALLVTLDYLPLAITYAASYIGEKGNISIKDYTSKLQESDEALISYLEQPGAPLRSNSSTPRSVVQTWLHSLNLILAKNAGAAHLLCLMACMERNAIHAKHLPPWKEDTSSMSEDRYWSSSSNSDAGSEDSDFFSPSDMGVKSEQRDDIGFPKNEADKATALSDLEALSLIKYHADDNVFSIHRFVQILTIHWLEAKQMDLGVDERISHSFYAFQQAIAGFLLSQITFANRVFMTDEDFQTTSELLPHAEWLLLRFEASSPCTLTIKKRLLDKVSRFYMIRGDLHASKDACKMLLDITRGNDLHVKLTMVAVLNLLGELDAANEICQELGMAFYPESKELTIHDVLPLTLLIDGGKNAAVVQAAREILKHVQTYDAQDVHPIALAIVNASFALCLLLEDAEPENVEVEECINKTFALLKEAKAAAALFTGRFFAQAPPTPQGLTYLNSTVYPGASISFKETTICETNVGVRGWSGYVNLPPSPQEGRDYPIHTWFWFFEARHDPENAPLSLWLQGGPGAPTSISAVNENGPCNLLNNSRDAVNNPWSWNDRVNMLYIDRPVQTGFSYDSLVNGKISEALSPFAVLPAQVPKNDTSLGGIFSSGNSSLAPNSTVAAAPSMWDFMQIWLKDFPGYSGNKQKFSIWGESYVGHWVPTFADYFYKQNDRISSGDLNATSLTIESLGLINACTDAETQIPFYPVMAANNTYGIKVFNDTTYADSMAALPKCLNMTKTCKSLASSVDPEGLGNNTDVNDACASAYLYCFDAVARETQLGNIEEYDAFHFDIASPFIHNFPPRWAAGYLNNASVQADLGVPLNFTGFSSVVAQEFAAAGDFLKGNNLAALGQLLDRGVKISLLYGDRDYQCNWFGGEAISLAINSSISSSFIREDVVMTG